MVVFVWVIRSEGPGTRPKCFLVYDLTIIPLENIGWIEDILLPALVGIPPSISVVVKLYLTNSEADPEKWANDKSDTNSTEKLDTSDTPHAQPTSIFDSPLVSLDKGRPDLQNLIQNEIANSSGRMSINGMPKLIVG